MGKAVAFRQQVKRGWAALYRHLAAPRQAGDLVVLTYHSILPDETFSTPPDVFARQLEYLVERFRLVSLDAWLQRAEGGGADQRPAALVSFDDGYENFFRFAFPLLQKFEVPALLFITTGLVTGGCGVAARLGMYGHLPPLSWGQLRELQAGGVTIGSHTHRHCDLGQATRAEAAEELTYSKKILEDQLEAPIKFFAYPWGYRQNIGRETSSVLRETGYLAACSSLWGKNTAATDPYLLRRVRVDAWDTPEDFRAKVEGAWDFIGLYQKFS